MKRDSGFAVAVVLLVSVVALLAVTSAAMVSGMTTRQVSTQERRATEALLAAESGLNALVARSRSATYLYESGSVSAWLAENGLREYSLPNGAQVRLSVVGAEDSGTGRVTIRSEGVAAGGSTRVVLQDFQLDSTTGDLGLFANAALITQRSLDTNSAGSYIIGRGSALDEWLFDGRELREGLTGEYFIVLEEGVETTYRIVDHAPNADGEIEVVEVLPAAGGDSIFLPGVTPGVLVPFALGEALDVPPQTTFKVSDTSAYEIGNDIVIGTGEVGEDGIATIVSMGDDELVVTWKTEPGVALPESTPIRRQVPSAIVGDLDGCPTGPKVDEKLPQGCTSQDLSNLWEKTFPSITKGQMLGLAKCDSVLASEYPEFVDPFTCEPSYYGPSAAQSWPASEPPLSGVTWIDGASTGDFNSSGGGKKKDDGGALCGEGVVILNTGVLETGQPPTSINMNVSGCDFSGVLYVIGDVGIQGNLESFSGTIIVETAVGTRVQGGTKGPPGTGGAKSLYDPIAIRRALANLPQGSVSVGLVGGVPASWRYGQ